MSLTVPNTRSYMLATESPLLTGMENLSQILTQMDAIERTKLDEEQARYDTQLRELQERTKPPLLSNFFWTVAGGAATFGGIYLCSQSDDKPRQRNGALVFALASAWLMRHKFEKIKEIAKEIDLVVKEAKNSVIDARIGRLKSKIRFLKTQLTTELTQAEKEQVSIGEDYLSQRLKEITSKKLNTHTMRIEYARDL